MSLKQRIKNYLDREHPRVVHKGEIARKAMDWGYLNENGGRRCRELENENVIERLPDNKGHVRYRFIKPLNLDQELDRLMQEYPVSWENKPILDEIQRAKKSRVDFPKQQVIKKYGSARIINK